MVNFRGSLIRELASRGHEIIALAPDYDADTAAAIEALGAKPLSVPIARLGTNPVEDLWTLVTLIRIFRRCRLDVVLSYTVKPIIYGGLAAWLVGIRRRYALVEGVGQIFAPIDKSIRSRLLRSVVETLYRVALSKVDRCFFLNDTDLSDFVELGLVAAQKTVQVGAIGLELSHWPPSTPVVDPTTFILVGRLQRQKGIFEFVEAARAIREQRPLVRFVIVGGVDHGPESIAEEQVKSWVAEGIVEWEGHTRVLPWLEDSSVFVLPSYREGAPRSIQEAMAVGRAVITTDVPGCRDMVVEGKNGVLVPPRDSRALAEAMLRFLDEPQLIINMGREGRVLAEQRFDASSFNIHLVGLMGL